ncbi:MAG: hypothetical protein GPJ54_00195, partial [Candidatus Heimdallarchaeota archaeon]|nr:hypothetical protein [Candidatus Heimdallarchaeota archaeon]
MKSDNILSKIFPQNILGKNLGKFAAKEFLDDLHLDTLIKNLKTGDKDRIKSILQNNDFLEIQLLDYAGHLHLVEGVSEFKIGNSINTLFVKSEEDSLIMHKLRLVRYLRNFKINDAFTEFQIIQAMQNDKVDKFTEFRVLCLKGRMLLRQRKYQESLNSFDLAFSLLELRFTLNERQQLIIDRVNRNKPIFQAPNWDSIIVDYDEIALYYYYAVTLYLMDDYDITQINSLLDNAEKLAVKYDSLIDKLNILHLKSEILVDLKNYTKAINNLQKGLSIMKLSKLINENIL